MIAFAGTHEHQSEDVQNVTTIAGVALLPGVALMGWLFVPVIGILSIITMCRGGIFRGILLLLGAPLSMLLAVVIGVAIIATTHQEAQAKPETEVAFRAEETLGPGLRRHYSAALMRRKDCLHEQLTSK